MTAARAALPASLVLATGNTGKLREMRAILEPWHVEVRSQAEFTADSAAETAVTFVENALLKARFAATHAGLPVWFGSRARNSAEIGPSNVCSLAASGSVPRSSSTRAW